MTFPSPNSILLVAVVLPPRALDVFGPVVAERTVSTPYGNVGPIAQRRGATDGPPDGVYVLPYSGLPERTDPRATLWAAKELGVQRVLNWDAAVALNPLLRRGSILLAEDYVDTTRHLPCSFFGEHGLGDLPQVPAFCPEMRRVLIQHLPDAHPAGVVIGVDVPRRETATEARLFRSWGGDVITRNQVPEVALAKELELCYAGLCVVTDLAADHPSPQATGEVRGALQSILEVLPVVAAALAGPPTCGCNQTMSGPRKQGLIGADWRTWVESS